MSYNPLVPVPQLFARLHIDHTTSRIFDISAVDSPAELMQIQTAAVSKGLSCVCCRRTMILGSSGGEYVLYDDAIVHHQQETREAYRQRQHLVEHLQRLFPRSEVAMSIEFDSGFADVLMITEDGGKLAVMLITEDWAPEALATHHKALIKEGVQPLWIQYAPNQLHGIKRIGGQRAKQHAHWRYDYDETTTELIKLDQQLWFVNERKLYLLIPHPGIYDADSIPRKIGTLETRLLQLPLSQLRLSHGLLSMFETPYDPMPWGILPKRFQ